ncbi:MAG: peptide ABC transporter substrate-binding protein [Anaerolineae bacterium]
MYKRVLSKSGCFRLFTLMVVVLLLVACVNQTGGPQATPTELQGTPVPTVSGRGAGDVLKLLYWEAPTFLNPHLTTGTKDLDVCRVVYEPLASFDKEGNLVPILAAEIPSLDNGSLDPGGLWVIWKLKQNVKWSDGQPFTADDVLFTFEYITNPDVGAYTIYSYDAVDNVEVLDEYTVKVNFKAPNPAWTLPFIGIDGMIIPRHVFEEYNNAGAREAPPNTLPVGTGPYYVLPPGIKPQEVLFLGTQLMETNKIVFEPNPYFREPDKPYFRRIELRGGGTVNEAARLVLEDGLVDFAYNLAISAEELDRLETDDSPGQIVANFGATVEMLELNRTDPNKETTEGERSSLEFPHPFFSDLKVRQAFSYAIDREAIAALYGPAGSPESNILVAPDLYASPNTSYEYDLGKAATLLDEAGWIDTDGDGIRDKDGVKMKVLYHTSENEIRQETQRIIKRALESIGIEVELKFIDAATYLGGDPDNPNTVEHFYADIQTYDISAFSPDPGGYMQFWTCAQIPQMENDWLAGLNTTRQCNPEYDALYDQSTRELDPEKRRQMFIEMNDMLIEDVVMVPLVRIARISGVSRSLEGVDLTPWDSSLWNIKDWRRATPDDTSGFLGNAQFYAALPLDRYFWDDDLSLGSLAYHRSEV